ncbi:methyl-accepting chemotaxis protein [Atlantibacter sp.]|uniref:methyl-accepting chemotaxis protein n=1 Tax=Atlantibacter sp. TaxID=1903473 RepID=UPI002898C054|nr:methyl-accepting chemotaxis protein [Atlantibacter sp.]
MKSIVFKFAGPGSGLNNIKIRSKLLASYLLLIMVTFFISAIAIYSLEKINKNNILQEKIVSIEKLLSESRYNNTHFTFTRDLKYFELQKKSQEAIILKLSELEQQTASGPEKEKFSRIQAKAVDYSSQTKLLMESIVAGKRLAESIKQSQLFALGDEIINRGRTAGFDVGIAEYAAYINLTIKDVRFKAEDLIARTSAVQQNDLAAPLRNMIEESERYRVGLSSSSVELVDKLIAESRDMQSNADLFTQNSIAQNKLISLTDNAAKQFYLAMDDFMQHQAVITNNTLSQARFAMIIATLAGGILATVIALLITKHITTPLNATLNIANRIAEGDLSATIVNDRKDEFGMLLHSISVMNNRLKYIITEVQSGVDNVSKASSEISTRNNDLYSRTELQSAALIQTSATLKQLTEAIKNNASNADIANKKTNEATANAEKGGVIVNKVISTMKNISSSSMKVAEITNVINGIAFQTNILALNAAVEAARAGEQGRGFAVVAGEVRTLAQRSANAAKEIETLINAAVVSIKDGSSLVTSSGEAMEEIVKSIQHIKDIIDEIATVSDEQSRGLTEINQAMSELDVTTQKNASLVEDSAVASVSLAEQAQKLNKLVSVFH